MKDKRTNDKSRFRFLDERDFQALSQEERGEYLARLIEDLKKRQMLPDDWPRRKND